MLDIFNNNAFSVTSLTAAINQMEYVSGRLGQLGLFRSKGITSKTASFELKNGRLVLVQSQPRGAPANQNTPTKRKMVDLPTIHLPLEDHIPADEIQGVRQFGSETALQTVQGVVNERLSSMNQNIEVTREHLRVGAIKGIILDADGSTLTNLYTAFGVSAPSDITFNFETDIDGALRTKCAGVARTIAHELGGTPFSGVHAMCGDDFYDALIANKEVRESYLAQQEASQLREATAYESFKFGGIVWENYRGYVNDADGAAVPFIAANQCRFFPMGVPELFLEVFSPGDFIETVNTVGLPVYAKQAVDPKFGRYVDLHVQSNPLPVCTRPRTLLKGVAS
jgi:hypothetical protein